MTKPVMVPQPAAAVDQVRAIALTDLRVAEWNARKTIELEALASLTESIKLHGVQVPLIVRRFKKIWRVSQGLFGIPDSKVFYAAALNVVGKENLNHTFTSGTREENRAAAQAKVDELNGPGDFEIVAGHRRFKAAAILKLHELPCILRDLDDVAAREIGLVDNLQREDVPALEEADAYAELLKEATGGAASIAARVGKDVAYVTKRLQLVSLSELARKALSERLITVDHALLLARLGQDEQAANLKWTLDRNAGSKTACELVIEASIKARDRKTGGYGSYWEPQSVKELKAHIEQNVGRKLNRAPWDLEDAKLLPEAGACSACPSNTKANGALFDDLNIAAATCADGLCFERKRATFVQIKLATIPKSNAGALANGAPNWIHPLRVSHKITTVEPRAPKPGAAEPDRDGFNPNQVFRYGQWIDAKKGSCEFVRQAVTVDWDEPGWDQSKKLKKPGQVVDVCIAAKCKVHRKGYAKQGGGNDGRQDEARREAEREKHKQEELQESKLRVAIASQVIEKITVLPLEAVRRIALSQLPTWDEELKPLEAILPGVVKTLETAKVDSVAFAKAVALVAFLGSRGTFRPDHYWIADTRKKFITAAKALGWKGPDPWAKAAETKPAKKTAAKKEASTPAKKTAKKKAAKR